MRRAIIGVLAAAGVLTGLTACDATSRPTESWTASGTAHAVLPTDTAPPPGLTAKMVVAGMDVDGVHATVSGYVSGVIENGGSCRYSIRGPGTEQNVESLGQADRSTTSCGAQQIPRSSLSTGEWTVTLTYRSLSGRTVVSPAMTMAIP